jgi:hypothetical protein
MVWAPEADRFPRYGNATIREQIFNIAEAKIESIVEPDYTTDNIRRKSNAFLSTNWTILPIPASLFGNTP